MEILFNYRWLFIKGDIIIGEWGIFGVEIFLCYNQFFIKGNFIIGRVECMPLVGAKHNFVTSVYFEATFPIKGMGFCLL